MSSSKSSSAQTSQSSTASYDQRIANESGIVVGPGANYTQNFPAEALDAVKVVLDFSSNVIEKVAGFADDSNDQQNAVARDLIASNRDFTNQQQLGTASLVKDLVPIFALGVVGMIFFFGFKRKK